MNYKIAFWIAAAVAFILLLVFWSFGVQHWIAWFTGSYNCPRAGCVGGVAHNYNFWSGFGSDLGEYVIASSIVGAAVTAWRLNTCHATWWCWRRPLHQLGDTPYKVCHVHHPEDVGDISQAMASAQERHKHRLYLGSKPGKG